MNNYLVSILIALCVISCSPGKKKALEQYTNAKELLEKKDFINATLAIDSAIALDSSNLDFQLIKARILEGNNNFEQAIKVLDSLKSKNFKLDTINYHLGTTYFGKAIHLSKSSDQINNINELNEEALYYLNNAIDLNFRYYGAFTDKIRVLHNLNRHKEALATINTAIDIFPDKIFFRYMRGIEKSYLGDNLGALNDLNNSLENSELDSVDIAMIYRFKGLINLRRDSLDEAINDFTNSINYSDSKNFYPFMSRGDCYIKKGLTDLACADYRKAADLGLIRIYDRIKRYCND